MGQALRASLAVTNRAPKAPALSSGEFPADLHGFRRVFPDRFAGLIRSHISTSPTHIAAFFSIDERTARDWLAGKSAPSGPFVAIVCARIPGAVEYLMGTA